RDNTHNEARNNGRPQRVQIVADITGQNQIVQCFLKWGRFRISDFELLSCPMPQFSYRARNAQGELVEGVLDCADRAIAIHQIEQQRCIPIRIEAVGARPEILLRLVKHLTQAKDLRDRVQQALIYPAFLAVAGTALITIFITYMVPQLTGFMAQIGGALPLPTRILMQIHHAITTYWWLAILIVIGASVGFRAFVRTEEGRLTWDRFRLSIPAYGR